MTGIIVIDKQELARQLAEKAVHYIATHFKYGGDDKTTLTTQLQEVLDKHF